MRLVGKARVFHSIERLLKHVGTTITCSADEAAFARNHIGVAPASQRTIANGVDCIRYGPGTAEEKRMAKVVVGLP